ncbi:MAG TPA: hypothetical protein VKY31_08485 [Terriglobia bacterium]|nr:hypothetical protein [Terriglobia bacterium]
MITSVSTWRCKCGAHIKVIAQTAKNKPGSTQEAACPKCGDKQIVYGEKIVSVAIEQDAPQHHEK